MHSRLRIGGAVLVGFLIACDADGPDVDAPVEVTESQSDQPIALAVGQELHVRLASNPTTGFGWSYECLPEGIVEPMGEPEYTPDTPALVGSGGVETFRFRGARAGRTTIAFEYRRPWETDSPPASTARYDVRVAE